MWARSKAPLIEEIEGKSRKVGTLLTSPQTSFLKVEVIARTIFLGVLFRS